MTTLRITAAMVVPLALSAACATNPVTGKRELSLMSEAQEVQIGQQSDTDIRKEMGVYPDEALQAYVDGLGQRLAAASHRPNLQWHFAVVDVAAVNAFALPGGYIYVTRGILPYLDNEAELAGVLGHEIGHVTARHASQQYTRAIGGELAVIGLGAFVPSSRQFGQLVSTGVGVLFLKYSRDDELQADDLGAQYEAKGGWDPMAVPEFLTTLGRLDAQSDRQGIPNWLMTHPQPADRVQRVQNKAQQLRTGVPTPVTNRDAYLQRVDGIVFGDDPREGIVRGSDFLHPALRFAVRMPPGWEIMNSKTAVVAKDPEADRYVVLQIADGAKGQSLPDTAAQTMANAGFQTADAGPSRINGLEAYVGTYRGGQDQASEAVVRAAFIQHGGHTYLLAGVAAPAAYAAAERRFNDAIVSFRALNRGEAEGIRPNRVALYVVRQGDAWASIAERASGGLVGAAALAVMNEHAVDDPPRPGERIKIVVAG
jgi:predicted Zn-dependent protease